MKTDLTPSATLERQGTSARPRPIRLSRLFTERLERDPSTRPFVAWALGGWVGLVCGLAESGLHLGWERFGGRVHDPDLWVNWNLPWLAPLSLAAYLAGLGALVSVVRRVLPRTVMFLAPYALIALGSWSALGAIPGLHPWARWLLVAGLAARLGTRARWDSERFRRFARVSLPYAAGLWLVLFVAYGVWPATRELRTLATGPQPPQGAPNVLLIVLDTVRADNLGLYGYDRATTPNLDTWARRGVRFDQARSTTPFTLGTHASLFTGYLMSQTSARVNAPLDGARRTLAEHLRDRGYATAGFVGNIFYGSAHYGLDRGFLHYHDVPGNITRRVTPREFLRACRLGEYVVTRFERKWRILSPMQRQRLDAGELNREALAWVDRTRPRERPFFLFLNYFDAHTPYSLPGDASQPFSYLTADRLEARMRHLQRSDEHAHRSDTPSDVAVSPELRAEAYAHLRNAYDDGIAWIDRKLDELLHGLEQRGLLENTLVLVTSDHGELLGEHGLIGHGDSLHRQAVHVPLVLLGPEAMNIPRGKAIGRPVSLRDVPATVLDLLDDPETGRFPGRSLRRFWTHAEGATADDEPVLSEMEHMHWLPRTSPIPAAFGPLWLLTEGRWSYHRQRHETLGTTERLFDLVADPDERRDLAADPAHRATLESLRARFDRADAITPDVSWSGTKPLGPK
ncbi:MAG: sulfatase-like hydrolase/transferase [Alphaproteobacteria bacterium]|nr:sulfatase-like hydrolase/transferase [Alphaproteobacteria bacterium]